MERNNYNTIKDGNIVLDSDKLSYHYDRVKQWEEGEKIAPVTVDMALTRACGAMCSFCYAMMQEPQERKNITVKDALNLADDFKEIGVKGVSLVSDGESTLSKAYVPFIKHASNIGLDVANATNGWQFGEEKVEEVLPHLEYLRFTVGGGTPEGYSKIMYKGADHTNVFDNAIKNIKFCVDYKKKHNLRCTIGTQMVLMPQFKDEILPFAKLSLDLGVDYGVIKHCSDDETGSLGVKYSEYANLTHLLKEAESMSNAQTLIKVKWEKINLAGDVPYKRFYSPRFLLQISGSGLVAPAGQFFNAKFSKFHIGNITETRFKKIYESNNYDKIMDYLISPYFDCKTMMGNYPLSHYVNLRLNNHLNNTNKIKPNKGDKPLHVNFL
jgi:MoaA/NifB/PqqE/SkfB family radical SAM enzyme